MDHQALRGDLQALRPRWVSHPHDPLMSESLVALRVTSPAPPEVLALLPPEELRLMLTISSDPRRQVSFAGGRIALRAALEGFGVPKHLLEAPILRDNRGRPVLPQGLTGSIAHKRDLVVAAALAPGVNARVGVDIELTERISDAFIARVAAAKELEPLRREGMPKNAAATRVFACKEAVFKALPPDLAEGIDFGDITLDLSQGRATVGNGLARANIRIRARSEGPWTLAVAEYKIAA